MVIQLTETEEQENHYTVIRQAQELKNGRGKSQM